MLKPCLNDCKQNGKLMIPNITQEGVCCGWLHGEKKHETEEKVYSPKSMVLAFHANQYYGINHIAQAPPLMDIDYRVIRKSFVTPQPPINCQSANIINISICKCKLNNIWTNHLIIGGKMYVINVNYTCGYRSRSNCKWPAVGRGWGNS